MDLRQLRYFVTVADSGSISAAASLLRVAQSAVSRQMRRLEEDVGGELFKRSVAGTALTDSGLMLLERARFILGEVENAANDVSTFSRGMRGTVRMAAPGSVGRALYVPTAQLFRTQYPQVHLELAETNTADVLQRLSAGLLDLGIVSDPSMHEHLAFMPLMREETVLLCPPGSPPTAGGPVPVAALRELPLIIPAGLRRIFQERFGDFRPALQIDGVGATAQLTMAGVGYAVLPRSTVSTSDALEPLVAVPIEGFVISRMLATVKGRPPSLAVRAFRAAIEAEVERCIETGLFSPI
ncbi:LysR family transcriptional regulator [Aquabacter sp. CN5-332]|uniref:LysR family transcriptional regulator n=1 Tax=Aquabacter sp. CN5-332 TaxID=3156608 RepID=UPI0032B353CE